MTPEEERMLSKLLAMCGEHDLEDCDSCSRPALRKELHVYEGSMGKTAYVCPECDLPEGWACKLSASARGNKTNRRYYFKCNARKVTQCEHPVSYSPLNQPEEPNVGVKRARP